FFLLEYMPVARSTIDIAARFHTLTPLMHLSTKYNANPERVHLSGSIVFKTPGKAANLPTFAAFSSSSLSAGAM
ncbi:MAG TPA: hypothetical protein PLM80_06025, partial [Mesotoga sp.]|nr:hypothetical protein [Mesotoga sp.]